jgi:isoquinoline 1-oxidoreductase subunit alpha
MIRFQLNGKLTSTETEPSTPLLWVLRDELGLTGTKFGCGMALCGACTVHLNNEPVRACVTPVSAVANQQVTTIEGLARNPIGKGVTAAWMKREVAQCGYCQTGQIMSAAALLRVNKKPTDADIIAAMAGNLCRCGTYARMREAIKEAAHAIAS